MIDPNDDRPSGSRTPGSRTSVPDDLTHTPADHPLLESVPLDTGSPRGRRRTRRNILWASLAFIVLGAGFLVVSVMMHLTLAPPIVVMVAGVLGAALSGVLRRASASDRAPRDV
jgi:Flp pilus assembly protein TadB